MSIKQAYKDLLILSTLVSLIFILIGTVYQYYQTHEEKMLYFGLFIGVLIVFGTLAKYRFFIDYVKTIFERWK